MLSWALGEPSGSDVDQIIWILRRMELWWWDVVAPLSALRQGGS